MSRKTIIQAIHITPRGDGTYIIRMYRDSQEHIIERQYDQERVRRYDRDADATYKLVNKLERTTFDVWVFPDRWAMWVAYVRPAPSFEEYFQKVVLPQTLASTERKLTDYVDNNTLI